MVNIKAAAGLAAVTLLIGLLGGNALAGDGTPAAIGPGPSDVTAGVPVGFERSKEGAIAAAIAHETSYTKSLLAPPSRRRTILDAITAAEMRDEIADTADQGADLILEGLGENPTDGLLTKDAVLGYRVVSYTTDSAQIELWGVAVFGKLGVADPKARWATSQTSLTWEAGDWKLAGVGQTKEGPTPAAADVATSPAELITEARTFKELDHAPK